MASMAGYPRAVVAAVRRGLRSVAPRRATLRADAMAGRPGAISSVPDGMASGVLAGVSPVTGLYASFAGPIAGGLTTSTRRMVITTTSAASLAAGAAVSSFADDERRDALIVLTLLAGVCMAIAGLARLGRYTRFVSHSVMLGFLTGVAINIVLGQLADLTGSPTSGSTNLAKAFKVIIHPGAIHWASLATGLGAIVVLVALARTRLAVVSTLVALVGPTVIVLLTGADVARVDDSGPIPSGFPVPTWPQFGLLNGPLLAGAAAVAAIVLVQGAGVAEAAPNEDGAASNSNRDFIAQGVANGASAMFRGMPVGGSVGQTALNIGAGGRTRWSAIMAGVWMLIILVAFAPIVGVVAMPTLAAVLIVAAVGSVRPGELLTIWHAGPNSQIAVASTFIATLLLPVPAAVGLGVVVSLFLQLNQDAIDLTVVELAQTDDGRFVEQDVPAELPSNTVTVLDVYGSLFYAGARTLQSHLPDPTDAQHPAVVLRLRGRTTLGATFFTVVTDYANRLGVAGGRLYLTGLDPALDERLEAMQITRSVDSLRLYPAHPVLGESTNLAVGNARTWLVAARDPSPADE